MDPATSEKLLQLICSIPALVLGLTIHEFAHAYVGWKLGDDTPKRMGRVTLDPLAHLDPLGCIFFLVAFWSGFGLGWAKPVPINPRNLGNPRRDSMFVAIAGPISNLLQVPIWLLVLYGVSLYANSKGIEIDPYEGKNFIDLATRAIYLGVVVNLSLAAFNMIPIPPLDGHWVLEAIGGPQVTEFFDAIRPYSLMILIVIMNFTPILRDLIGPIRKYGWDTCDRILYGY